jgi:hypothetical protein
MSKTTAFTLSAIALCTLTPGAGFAAQPPDVVASDSDFNTAMGSYSLYYLTTGEYNTAAGAQALFQNTTAWMNSAFGMYSLYGNTTGA